MFKLKFHPSSLGEIMTEPKAKGEALSVGAKTAIERMAKQHVYGFESTVTSKYLEKGLAVEDQSIALYNSVHFTNYAKNKERRENDWLTGECDIFTGSKIIDIKSAWSLETFPATSASAHNKDYEWQVRSYMWLWDVEESEVAYCMVTTPDELIRYENPDIHYVDHIDPALRVTSVFYTRDRDVEQKIAEKAEAANKYYQSLIEQILDEHCA